MGAYKNAVLATPGLIDFWDLDELSGTSASDSGPGSLAGVYTGGITQGIAAGPSGKSCLFDGSTGRVAVATCPLDRADNLSLEVWLRTSDVSQIEQCAFGYGDGQDTAQRGIAIIISGNATAGGAINILYHGVAWQSSPAAVANNVWSHIVAAIDVGGALNVYHQGIHLPITGVSMHVPVAGDGVCIGSQSAAAGGRYFKGNLDAAALYNVPISAATALAHYNLGEFRTSAAKRRKKKMPEKRFVGSPAIPIYVDLYLAGTNTPATGKSPTVTISKNLGAFATPAGTVAEVSSSGRYAITGAGLKADLGTEGMVTVMGVEATCDTNKQDFAVCSSYGNGFPG